jgi:hypothetical protein
MSQLEQAKQQIARAEQQAREQRELVESRRAEAQKQQELISSQESKLPTPSQKLLRGGMFSGLEGRKRRQTISKVKGELGEQKKQVGLFKEELTKFEETEIKPFEEEISKRKGEVAEYERHQKAIRLAEDVYYGSKDARVFFFGSNPLAKKYYDKMILQQSAQIEAQAKLQSLPMSPAPSVQDKRTELLNKLFGTTIAQQKSWEVFKPSVSIAPPRDLKMTELKKDFSPISTMGFSDTPTLFRPFTTTGSPIRKTPLLSGKPVRPPTPSVPVKRIPIQRKAFRPEPMPKMKSNSFFSSDKKQKKKGKSFWGF